MGKGKVALAVVVIFLLCVCAKGFCSGYTIVDTGQETCYNNDQEITCPQPGVPFYGQDAQYAGNQPSYTLSADGLTVYDNVTGLTWTQSPDLNGDGNIDVDDKLTFAEAQAYPDTLNAANYGGYSDWRLPTIKELYSLMDFRGTDPSGYSGSDTSGLTPFIDTTYFDFDYGDTDAGERIIDAQFWSNTIYLGTVFGDQTATFGLNLADGRIKGYPSDTSGPNPKLNYVYFARGNTTYGVNNFTDNGDGTITDNATGLMWSQDDSGVALNWEEALAWVETKNAANYLGHNDWRLPNAKEMQSILDYNRAPDATNSAAIDPVFNITQITNEAGEVDYPWFWTGTTHVMSNGSGFAGVYICFGRAMGYMNDTWMDVHGAGAQRSDPKNGDPAEWPYGHGPQGDAIRIYNYVRCVRDARVAEEDSTILHTDGAVWSSDSGWVLTTPPYYPDTNYAVDLEYWADNDYLILHKEGALWDSDAGWMLTCPPYYPGTVWAVDVEISALDEEVILHRDGALWYSDTGWVMTTPPYYAGSDYARALELRADTSYVILHMYGAIYDSAAGWVMSTPPYYPGSHWAVDMQLEAGGYVLLHQDGAVWSSSGGWVMTTPPYYAGSGYARAVELVGTDYVILHQDGAIYDSVSGWNMDTPPYYPGSGYAVDLEVQ